MNIPELVRDSNLLAQLLVSVFRQKSVPSELAIATLGEVLAQYVSAVRDPEMYAQTRELITQTWLPQRMDELFRARTQPTSDAPRPELIV